MLQPISSEWFINRGLLILCIWHTWSKKWWWCKHNAFIYMLHETQVGIATLLATYFISNFIRATYFISNFIRQLEYHNIRTSLAACTWRQSSIRYSLRRDTQTYASSKIKSSNNWTTIAKLWPISTVPLDRASVTSIMGMGMGCVWLYALAWHTVSSLLPSNQHAFVVAQFFECARWEIPEWIN